MLSNGTLFDSVRRFYASVSRGRRTMCSISNGETTGGGGGVERYIHEESRIGAKGAATMLLGTLQLRPHVGGGPGGTLGMRRSRSSITECSASEPQIVPLSLVSSIEVSSFKSFVPQVP